MGRSSLNPERGAITVITAMIAGIGVLACIVIGAWLTVAQSQKKVSQAADFAALAAADAARGLNPGDPCQLAAAVIRRYEVQQEACVIETTGDTVTVTATVPLPGALRILGPARAQARAGPPPAD